MASFTPHQPEPTVSMTAAQLQEMMQTMMAGLVAELKKPTAAELKAEAKENADLERKRQDMVMMAREAEKVKASLAGCDHKKPDGKYSVGGQVFSDGIERHFCLRCQKVVNSFSPLASSMAGGLGNVTDAF